MAKIFQKTIAKAALPEPKAEELAKVPSADSVTDAEQAYLQGRKLNDLLQVDRAVSMLERALELDPEHAEAVSELGRTWLDLGRNDEAVALFEKTLEAYPRLAEVRLQFAACLLRLGKVEWAAKECAVCREHRPNWKAPHRTEILALCRSGQAESARAVLQDFMRFEPDVRTVDMLKKVIERT